MNAKYKKSLKIVTLLITAAFIATASADIYNYLNFSAGVGVAGLDLQWDNTDLDSGLSANIQGATCTLTGLKAPKGGSRTYSKAIRLKATADTSFDIQVVDVTGDSTGDLNYILINIYDEGNQLKGTLTVWQNNQKGTTPVENLDIQDTDVWRLEWVIAWKTSADDIDAVTVTLKVTTPSP